VGVVRGGGTTTARQPPDRQREQPRRGRRAEDVDSDETASWLGWLHGDTAPVEATRPDVTGAVGSRPRPGSGTTGYRRDGGPGGRAAYPTVAETPATDEFPLVGVEPRGDRRDGYHVPTQPQAPLAQPRRAGRVALLDGEAGMRRVERLPVAPGSAAVGNRLFILIMFWVTLAVSVELWWVDTPDAPSGAGGLLIAAGRITGMAGGFLLLAQVLMMSRVAWLEQWIGAHDLLIWHRWLGTFLVVLIPAHAVFLIFGYASAEQSSAAGETWLMLRTYPAMISAFVATGILVAVGVLAIRWVRRRMGYEWWYYLHLTSYLVLLWGYGHQFAAGADLVRDGFGRRYWFSLYMFVIVAVFWGRLVEPLWLNLRHRFRVTAVVSEAPNMISIYVGGRRLDRLEAKAGQFFRWRFLTRRGWWQAHPFSLSAAPNEEWLRLTVKVVGDHTRDLQQLVPGDRVFAEGPSGAFTADRRVNPGALLIAGGSGIAPIRALLEDLPDGTIVLYRASTAEDLVFRDELDALARQRGAWVWYVLGSRDDPATKHAFSPAGMRKLVPDLRRRDVYLCGPQGIIDASVKTLRRMRVPKKHIHLDPFEF
jgi:predicted ferric reductase